MSRYSRTDPSLARLRDLQLPVELRPSQPPAGRFGWALLTVIGLLICIADGIWLSQDFWLAQPAVRVALTPVLDSVGYELRRPRLSDAWQTTALTMRAEPSDTKVWHIDALLTNRADILQVWPRLQLDLRDWQGQRIAQRLLQPADYLPAALPLRRDSQALIGSDQPVQISVAVTLPLDSDGQVTKFEQAELRPLP